MKQVGGDHYSVSEGPDHLTYCMIRDFDCYQYVITKWVERWKKKGGIQDLHKARHALDRYIEAEEKELAKVQGIKA